MKTVEQILVIDDEEKFREIMGKFLTRRKAAFKTANCCAEALDLFAEHEFDVALLDVCMPGLDGLDCMAELRKLNPSLKVIFLTGHVSLGAGIAGIRQGAFDYCLKPVDFDELYEKIALARKKLREENASCETI